MVKVPLPVLLLELRAVDELQLVVEAPLPVLLLALATVGDPPRCTCGLWAKVYILSLLSTSMMSAAVSGSSS